eukprot:3612496-Amphidinium_carterae.1
MSKVPPHMAHSLKTTPAKHLSEPVPQTLCRLGSRECQGAETAEALHGDDLGRAMRTKPSLGMLTSPPNCQGWTHKLSTLATSHMNHNTTEGQRSVNDRRNEVLEGARRGRLDDTEAQVLLLSIDGSMAVLALNC